MLRKLSGHSLTTEALFKAESMSLDLREKDSSATMTLGPEECDLSTGDWVQDLDEPGKGIVWRVRSIDTQYDKETRTVVLEHSIATLGDVIIPSELSADGTAKAAINAILAKQSDWKLGTFEYTTSNPYKFDGDTLKAAFDTVINSLEDACLEYDFSSYPFKISVKQPSDTPDSELRANRNITTLKYTEDRTRMYTRFYPVGKNNLKLSGSGYVSKNESLYGRIDKTETDQSKTTEAELTAWANERLSRHAKPNVTVTVSGLDLSQATGEDLDSFTIGRKCRIPLPDGTVILEKVTKLNWRDKIKEPENVTITLASLLEDVQSIIREEKQKSGGGGRAAAKVDEENVTLMGEIEEGMYSLITQTSTNIMQEVHNEVSDMHSLVEQTASEIRGEVWSNKSSLYSIVKQTSTNFMREIVDAKSEMGTLVEETASGIRTEIWSGKSSLYSIVLETSTNFERKIVNETASIQSRISQEANRISLVVEGTGENASIKPASIVAAINESGDSSITLSADHIDIDGVVTKLASKDISCGGLHVEGDPEFLKVAYFEAGLSSEENIVCPGVTIDFKTATWQSFAHRALTFGNRSYFLYANSSSAQTPSGSYYAYPITAYSTSTIYYLGRTNE